MTFLYYGNPFYMYWDPTYIYIIIGALICAVASAIVRSTFNRYSSVRSTSGYNGASAAEAILRRAGIYDVRVERVSGHLTDHYDPRNKVLKLSDSVYGSNSVAAIGVAAHECGHAIQDAKNYVPLKMRAALVPIANFGTGISWLLIMLGLFIQSTSGDMIITLGVIAFSAGVAFQLVTLPVEFNASRRALSILSETGILSTREENAGARKVLSAAALTYVAGAVASILQLLRILIIIGGRRRDD